MKRIALGIEYEGSNYFGWQRQQEVPSVQQCLEQALSKVADHPIELVCAGRTDAGVHATNQIVHFDTDVERPDRAWTLGVNANLPDDIAVKWVKEVASDFHARFSATARRYRYLIYNSKCRPGINTDCLTHVHSELDHERMHEAAQSLLGEQDFSAFRAAMCQSNTPFRCIEFVNVHRAGNYLIVDIKANAFLHHMVRNIVGSLCEVGTQEQPVGWIKELLEGRDRTKAAATAKPNGLFLVSVDYPEEYGIPETPLGPIFLPDILN